MQKAIEIWKARRECFSTEGLAATIRVAMSGVELGEQRVNAEHKSISSEYGDGTIARSVRDIHVALKNAREFKIPLPVDVVESALRIEAKHLDTAKAYFEKVEKSWGEGTKLYW